MQIQQLSSRHCSVFITVLCAGVESPFCIYENDQNNLPTDKWQSQGLHLLSTKHPHPPVILRAAVNEQLMVFLERMECAHVSPLHPHTCASDRDVSVSPSASTLVLVTLSFFSFCVCTYLYVEVYSVLVYVFLYMCTVCICVYVCIFVCVSIYLWHMCVWYLCLCI